MRPDDNYTNALGTMVAVMRTGGRPKCNIDEAFIEIATALMSVESYRKKREVRWDAKSETIV